MLRPRIIPCLLVHKRGLVKTVGFAQPKYVGDPVNAVKIFNEKQVDELIVVDIDATRNGADPDYGLIGRIAVESRMPLCYGGGVRTAEQAKRIIGLGVEKVAVSAEAIARPALVGEMAASVGSQSVVVVLDVRQKRGGYEVWTHNGTRNTRRSPVELAVEAQANGAGEIVINSIDRDGMMKGYDLDLAQSIRNAVTVPITVLGGAGSLADIGAMVNRFGVIGAAAGSLFVFKGAYKAVLINYPPLVDRDALFTRSQPAAR